MAIRSIRIVIFAVMMLASAWSFGQVGISISFGPPPLPVYEQPLCPGDGFLWTPGYWAYDYNYGDYYWVPGTWVRAPRVGLFWTPGYWGWGGNGFRFYEGYWGPQVGFYGGINYGYGYFGDGYQGGRWQRGRFYYNRSVNNVNVTNIHNVYNTTIVNRTTVVNRVSYNGGNGGVNVRPTRQQETFARERHVPPVAAQTQHIREARADVQLRASQNHGKPPVAATQRPGAFRDRGVVPAREAGGAYNPPPDRRETRATENRQNPNNGANRDNVNRPNDRANGSPRMDRPAKTGTASTGNRNDQQQRENMRRQEQERPQVQQRQQQENAARQQNEQRQQQQREAQQQQKQEQRQQQQQQKQEQRQQQQREQPQHQNQPKPQREDRPPNEQHQP